MNDLQRMSSLCLPSSAHLSSSLFKGSPQCAFILMKMVRRPCLIRSRKSCTMCLMMLASGFPHIEGDLPSPIHFWEEDRKHAAGPSLIRGLLGFHPVYSLHLPVLGMLLLVQVCWKSCLPPLYPAGSILPCYHLICSSPPPRLPCHWTHL